jgi:holo-[acyl-carrier protein] synthase
MNPKIYIGIDLINLLKVKKTLSRCGERFVNRIATPAELEYYCGGSERRFVEGVASLFAIKEAVKKICLQNGLNPNWKHIQVFHHPSGKPWVDFSEKRLKQKFENISLSLSHTAEMVVAVAVGVERNFENTEVEQ